MSSGVEFSSSSIERSFAPTMSRSSIARTFSWNRAPGNRSCSFRTSRRLPNNARAASFQSHVRLSSPSNQTSR
jgi:hypothetical protein